MGFILYKFSQLSISSLSLGLSANTSQYYPCARLEEIFSLFLSCVGRSPSIQTAYTCCLRSSWVENEQEALHLDLSHAILAPGDCFSYFLVLVEIGDCDK